MDRQKVNRVLKRLVYGVYLLTARSGNEINGMPVSWVSQVSHEPPLIMVCVAQERYTHAMMESSRAFALNIMARGQKGLVDSFMARGIPKSEKFKMVRYREGITGSPLLKDALAYLECRITDTLDTGDHTIFVGEVVDAASMGKGSPLSESDYGHSYGG